MSIELALKANEERDRELSDALRDPDYLSGLIRRDSARLVASVSCELRGSDATGRGLWISRKMYCDPHFAAKVEETARLIHEYVRAARGTL